MEPLGIAMIGHAFMGAVHSQAWRTVRHAFPLPRSVNMTVLAGRDEARAQAAADGLGWQHATGDWRAAIARDDVHIVDICTPGAQHAEIAIAALEQGKHVLCEKPLATTVTQAEEMARAARAARDQGVRSMVAFNYRRVPAIALGKQLIEQGRLGTIRQVRAAYLQDWLHDPQAPFSWRLDRDLAGAGALGDIGSHAIDLSEYLVGEYLDGVSGQLATFVDKRPKPGQADGEYGTVTVDDAAVFTGRFTGGALAVYEATRYASGRKNALRIEVNGTKGSLAFDFERMNELSFYDATEPGETAGYRQILATEPDHPYLHAWWPPGHGLGYEHAFTHEARDFVHAVVEGTDPEPSFEDGLHIQRAIDAVQRSAADEGRYTRIEPGS